MSHEIEQVVGHELKPQTSYDWEAAREDIRELYITQKKTLKEVKAEMKMRGFHASERMFKSRLESWGLGKNASRQDWHAFALLMEGRRVAGLPLCRILIHNKPKTSADFRRYLKEQKMTELDFLAEATMAGADIPFHVRIETSHNNDVIGGRDPGSYATEMSSQDSGTFSLELDQSHRDIPLLPFNFSDEPAIWCFDIDFDPEVSNLFDPLTDVTVPPPLNPELGNMIEGSYDFESWLSFPDLDDILNQTPLPGETVFSNAVQGRKRKLEEVAGENRKLPPRPPTIRVSEMLTAPSTITTLSPLGSKSVAVGEVHLEQNDASSFLAACMAACMYGALGRYDILALSLVQASASARKMCVSNDPLLLSVIAVILAWLRVHAEGSLPESILRSTHHAAIEVFGESHAICLLLEWMTAAAAGDLRHCRIKSSTLRKMCGKITQTYGDTHSNSIVAVYCLGFQLLHEKLYQEAETLLQELFTIAAKALGPSDLQTINILATISRAQSRQSKFMLALDTIRRSLKGAPLGLNHPHRLELMIREALICRKLGHMKDVQRLYWTVVEGRAATLGAHHASTQKAHESLVTILQENGTWESLKDKAQRLLTEPQVVVTEDESAWQVMMLKMDQATKDERAAHVEVE